MVKLTIQELQAQLPDIIHNLQMGEEILVFENDLPVAKLVKPIPKIKQLGKLRGSVLHIADDFSAPLEEFQEYME
ncbi:type II toxin-antitoxin system Phd/YefM family antitoxin [Gloeomargarita lithophora]|uniref:type II toxin-antitoxin system Phd/YefM family antitoxin n=1 Tax=Gloeomargarita lithophora TaxID=1188228 RepID=UPI003F6FC5C6